MTFLTFTSDSESSKRQTNAIPISDIERIYPYIDRDGKPDGTSVIKTKAGSLEEYYAKESVEALVKQINS